MKLSLEEIERRRNEHFASTAKGLELVKKLFEISGGINPELYNKLLKEYQDTFPVVCEHDKSMVEDCMACDDIFKQCFPENCFKCETCQSLFVNEDEVNEFGRCSDCDIDFSSL